jgi:hypothetical protein
VGVGVGVGDGVTATGAPPLGWLPPPQEMSDMNANTEAALRSVAESESMAFVPLDCSTRCGCVLSRVHDGLMMNRRWIADVSPNERHSGRTERSCRSRFGGSFFSKLKVPGSSSMSAMGRLRLVGW